MQPQQTDQYCGLYTSWGSAVSWNTDGYRPYTHAPSFIPYVNKYHLRVSSPFCPLVPLISVYSMTSAVHIIFYNAIGYCSGGDVVGWFINRRRLHLEVLKHARSTTAKCTIRACSPHKQHTYLPHTRCGGVAVWRSAHGDGIVSAVRRRCWQAREAPGQPAGECTD
jgi:hypothetical protein